MSTRILNPSAGFRPATGDLTDDHKCGCGEIVEECWECGLQLCEECARIRIVDGYRAVCCPMCASSLVRGDGS